MIRSGSQATDVSTKIERRAMERTEEDLIETIFVNLNETVPKRTIDKVLRTYAALKVADAIGEAKPRPEE